MIMDGINIPTYEEGKVEEDKLFGGSGEFSYSQYSLYYENGEVSLSNLFAYIYVIGGEKDMGDDEYIEKALAYIMPYISGGELEVTILKKLYDKEDIYLYLQDVEDNNRRKNIIEYLRCDKSNKGEGLYVLDKIFGTGDGENAEKYIKQSWSKFNTEEDKKQYEMLQVLFSLKSKYRI
ncbi:MAG: hypothetical protein GY828_00155 [Candidatus Gracilibacteria bacterium]|nr:hypothetical protein [Candidatus Gracilibacteria bacterium]